MTDPGALNPLVDRHVVALFVEDLERSKQFYVDLLGLRPVFEASWIIQLSSDANSNINLTLQPRSHSLVPKGFQKAPQGFCMTFVVDNTDSVFERAKELGLRIIREPADEEYGQRRFLTVDPDGALVDISSPCEPSADFIAKYFN